MNKWYFSKDNTITEPMDFESAKKYVAANLDSYGMATVIYPMASCTLH